MSDAVVELQHDVMGNLVKVVHAGGAGNTTMSYDLLGHKTSMNDVDLGNWTYAYDLKGNLVRQIDARGLGDLPPI